MPTSAYRSDFYQRWHSTPTAIKQALYQELEDIIGLLQSDSNAKSYSFTYPDFDATIEVLLLPNKHNTNSIKFMPTTAKTDAPYTATQTAQPDDKHIIAQHIYDKLSAQIDDALSKHLGQLSDDLKTWLKTAIDDELR